MTLHRIAIAGTCALTFVLFDPGTQQAEARHRRCRGHHHHRGYDACCHHDWNSCSFAGGGCCGNAFYGGQPGHGYVQGGPAYHQGTHGYGHADYGRPSGTYSQGTIRHGAAYRGDMGPYSDPADPNLRGDAQFQGDAPFRNEAEFRGELEQQGDAPAGNIDADADASVEGGTPPLERNTETDSPEEAGAGPNAAQQNRPEAENQ